jgi:ABC-type uncharacterized transport system auxiliary subunit
MKKTAASALCCLWLVFLLLPGGCSLKPGEHRPSRYYQLEYPPPVPASGDPALPFVIRVEPFGPSELYGGQRILYRTGAHEANHYVYHHWVTSPDRMVPRLIARDLRHAGIVEGVFLNSAEPGTHRLVGHMEALYAAAEKEPAKAVFSAVVTLIDIRPGAAGGRICFQETYTARAACSGNTPAAFAEAASRAMADASRELISDVRSALQDAAKKKQAPHLR